MNDSRDGVNESGLQRVEPSLELGATMNAWNAELLELDLSSISNPQSIGREIHNYRITGEAEGWEFPASVYNCRYETAHFVDCVFPNKDFKGCTFIDTVFSFCEINLSSIVSCAFYNCTFVDTKIVDEAIHDCRFVDCSFQRTSILGSMVRNSQVLSSTFTECTTSNKVFDSCLLIGNDFNKTKLDFLAIVDNFGLHKGLLPESDIRVDRSYPNDAPYSFSNLDEEGFSSLKRWRIGYYQNHGFGFLDDSMLDIFDVESWIREVQSAPNLSRLISDITTFICTEYDLNRCISFFVYRLYSVLYFIWEDAKKNEALYEVQQTALACQMKLRAIISDIEIIINNLADKAISDGSIRFRTSGEHDEQAVKDFVQHGKAIGGVFQIKIIRRNSPLDLLITWAEANAAYCISSLFVFTKFKFEILKMHFNEKTENDLVPAQAEGKKHFSASIGLAPDARSSDLIHFSFLLPGQYKFDLAYKLRTDILRLAHSLLTKFIVESHAEPPTPEA